MKLNKFLAGFLGVAFVLSFAYASDQDAVAPGKHTVTTVTAKAPEKAWSVSSYYEVARAVDTTDAVAGKGLLDMGWDWNESLSTTLSLGFTNKLGETDSLVALDPGVSIDASNLVSILGLGFNGNLSLTAPVAEKSLADAEGFYVQASTGLSLNEAQEIGVFKVGGAEPLTGTLSGISVSYNAARTTGAGNDLAGISTMLSASAKWLDLSLWSSLGISSSWHHEASTDVKATFIPVVSWSIFSIEKVMSVSLLTASMISATTDSSKMSATSYISPSVKWFPVEGATLKLSYTSKFADTEWSEITDAENHTAKLAFSYEL